jgi:hypothetical protein
MKHPPSWSANVLRGQLQEPNQKRKPTMKAKSSRFDSLVAWLGLERRQEIGRAAAAARWAKNRAGMHANRKARRAQKVASGVEDNAAVRRFVGDELAGSGLLDVLPKREQIIILARFGLDGGKPKTLEEIGKQFGITRERIRQLQNAALSKLSRARAAEDHPTMP